MFACVALGPCFRSLLELESHWVGGMVSPCTSHPTGRVHSQLSLGCVLGHSGCLYKRSERQLGSRDLGAVVVVESFHGQESRLQLQGIQFRHVGQTFQHHCSALTVTGNTWMAGELPALEIHTFSCPKLGQAPSNPAWLLSHLANCIVKCEKIPSPLV